MEERTQEQNRESRKQAAGDIRGIPGGTSTSALGNKCPTQSSKFAIEPWGSVVMDEQPVMTSTIKEMGEALGQSWAKSKFWPTT